MIVHINFFTKNSTNRTLHLIHKKTHVVFLLNTYQSNDNLIMFRLFE